MVTFIDQHRDVYGVEPICAVLPIAPSTYFLRKAQQGDRNRTHRWRAALMLSMLDRREAGPVLLRGLRSSDAWIQWEALNAIRSLGVAGAEGAVSRFLGPRQPPDHRQEAVLALGAIGSRKALALVRKALADADPDVRWRASLALAATGDRRWCGHLRRQLARETNRSVVSQLREDIEYLETLRDGHTSRGGKETRARRSPPAATG